MANVGNIFKGRLNLLSCDTKAAKKIGPYLLCICRFGEEMTVVPCVLARMFRPLVSETSNLSAATLTRDCLSANIYIFIEFMHLPNHLNESFQFNSSITHLNH